MHIQSNLDSGRVDFAVDNQSSHRNPYGDHDRQVLSMRQGTGLDALSM